ncbi:hypothetical protein GCM10007916_00280 [Psychromonas marina]|uniref:Prevent-host-death protein n=2 Tax=Psychromonas marina TaxID=88364 RepID=A0ABQ6DV39_9GAMM|nr:hypothetical protein GCM10007916_00280 [Psychromonas marina]
MMKKDKLTSFSESSEEATLLLVLLNAAREDMKYGRVISSNSFKNRLEQRKSKIIEAK